MASQMTMGKCDTCRAQERRMGTVTRSFFEFARPCSGLSIVCDAAAPPTERRSGIDAGCSAVCGESGDPAYTM